MKHITAFIYRIGYPIAKCYWFFRRPTTRGVRCVITHGDKILLVRHTYGSRALTTVGGGVAKNESPQEAIIREVREEVGLSLQNIQPIGELNYFEEFKNDTIYVFFAEATHAKLSIDHTEIQEASWHPIGGIPEDVSPLFTKFYTLAKPYFSQQR